MGSLRIEHLGFGADAVEYMAGWARQREVHAEVAAGAPDTVLLLEHQAVYTAGKRTEPAERPVDGTPVVDVDRGGKITWHGPGQLVGYPIVQLARPIDVVAYVRRLEQMIIEVCATVGVHGVQVEGRSGVWIPARGGRPERKVAPIGIRVARHGVTMHGFALTCDSELSAFGQIIPCGISDAGVTSLSAEVGRRVTVQEMLPVVEDALQRWDLPGHESHRLQQQQLGTTPLPVAPPVATPAGQVTAAVVPRETISGAIGELTRHLSQSGAGPAERS